MRSSKHQWTEEEIEHLRFLRMQERYSLSAIGRIYGISRERVRQLIGNTGYIQLANIVAVQKDISRMSREGMPPEEIAKRVGMHYKSVERILRNMQRDP